LDDEGYETERQKGKRKVVEWMAERERQEIRG
jgi:hypothetical protein